MMSTAPAIETALQGFVFHQLLAILCALWAGLLLGIFLTLVGLVGVSRVVTWWTEDVPSARAAKAVMASARVPAEHRRSVIQAVRRVWGEGPFRTVP